MTTIQVQPTNLDETASALFTQGLNGQPHDLLGQHPGPAGLTITVYRPMARTVAVRLDNGDEFGLLHAREGLWSATVPGMSETHDYRILVSYDDGVVHEQDDPYRFAPTLGDIDRHLINEGRHEQLWAVLGSHIRDYEGVIGTVRGASFAVWAPNAQAVHVVGDFNGWDFRSHPMRMLGQTGVWELYIPDVGEGSNYQYAVTGSDGGVRTKSDPMARRTECPPRVASVVTSSSYTWSDDEWMKQRAYKNPHEGPMSAYEVHLASWRQGLTYTEMAEHLVNYVKDLGFTHIELLPVMEHPYGPSWGYQVTGFFAPTARFGTPDEFRYLVDRLHQEGIGVLLDWVPGHFPKDDFGLARFDGQALYEHPDPRRGDQPEWGTHVFDFGRPEVRNFLVASGIYWLEEFHIDGLRVDAVASMLYLDYSRKDGEWLPNAFGGRENLDAIQFLQETNATVYKRVPGIVTIAEESTSWGGVTGSTDSGGLGFGYKWNMGWMNDALSYLSHEPVHRQFHHNDMTFSMVYAYSENFILPISHDEVVHGKGSLLRKIPGWRNDQLATVRAFLAFMWSHPGKQLIFMGTEFAQESEWADGHSLDWWLLDQPAHYRIHAQVKEMNAIYLSHPAMWELDSSPAGFTWLNADDASHNVFSFVRFGRTDTAGKTPALVSVVNFSGTTHEFYRIGLPFGGKWRVILDTAGYFPEAPSSTGVVVEAEGMPWNNQPFATNIVVPSLSGVWLVPDDGDEPADASVGADAADAAASSDEKSTARTPATKA